jgi:hypothetical protein
VRTALALGALVFGTSPVVITSLPRPGFPGPTAAPSGAHRLVLVSSHKAGFSTPSAGAPQAAPFRGLPLQTIYRTANRLFLLYGKDGSTGRYLLAATKTGSTLYGFDFGSYGRPPKIKPGDRDLVWEQPMWAQESGGVLYVETALLLPNAPERITWQAGHVHVHTYDHNVVVLLRGE